MVFAVSRVADCPAYDSYHLIISISSHSTRKPQPSYKTQTARVKTNLFLLRSVCAIENSRIGLSSILIVIGRPLLPSPPPPSLNSSTGLLDAYRSIGSGGNGVNLASTCSGILRKSPLPSLRCCERLFW